MSNSVADRFRFFARFKANSHFSNRRSRATPSNVLSINSDAARTAREFTSVCNYQARRPNFPISAPPCSHSLPGELVARIRVELAITRGEVGTSLQIAFIDEKRFDSACQLIFERWINGQEIHRLLLDPAKPPSPSPSIFFF